MTAADLENSKIKAFSSAYIANKTFKIGVVLMFLYFVSLKDYLLFHSVVEFFSAIIAVSIFLLAWNSRKFADNSFYVFLGAVFLASGIVTILHTLAYRGMGIIPGTEQDANLATQLWLVNQYVLAVGFVAAPLVADRKLKSAAALFVFGTVVALLLLSIFWWKNFPVAYAEGKGLTGFKNYSEYIAAFLFLLSGYLFFRMKRKFDFRVVNLFYLILILFAGSTLFFTMYFNVYGSFNMWGHLIRLAALYPVYLAVVEFGLMRPYKFLFGNLKNREESLKKNEKMLQAIIRDQTELICRFLPDGTLTFANDAFCRYYGKSRGALVGKKYFENFSKEAVEEEKKRLARLTQDNPILHADHRVVDKNGWKRWQSRTTRAIFGPNGEVVEFQSVSRDITDQKYAEEALQKSEETYRMLVENSLVGIYRLDKNGNYAYVNEAMARIFEFDSPGEMLRENVQKRYNKPEERASFLRLIREKKRLSNYEVEGLTKTGKKITVLAAVALVGDEIMGVIVDVTEKKRAEEDLKKAAEEWTMTFNSISDPIFILDVDHTIVKVNQAMLDFFGKSEAEVVGKKCYEIVHKKNRPWAACPLVKTCRNGKSHTEEVDDPAVGKVLLVTTSPIKNSRGEMVGVAHIAKDITERKKIEKAKDEFVSLASHQLRTPLASVALSAELLLRGTAGEMRAEQKEYLEEIFKSAKKMALMVNNLLNVSRVEMGNFEVGSGSLDIVAAVESSIREFSPLSAGKNLAVRLNAEENIPKVNLDEKSFGIVFDNLLSNAIRYTPAGGEIKVGLSKGDAGVLFSVSDTGCGIPEGQKKKIFTKSFRASNAKEISSEGAGLGLYMVRVAAEKSGAKIRFESEEGKGTTFFVEFAK